MARGRPSLGVAHVDGLEGTQDSKRRLRLILETLTGERSVQEVCKKLEISESRFHQLRRQALEGALAGLESRPSGRPRTPLPEQASRVAELEAEVRDLRIDLQGARVRTEIALAMPHLLRDKKKNRRKP